jgi:RNA polymerase sigma factor (sigma-70 family)
VDIYEQWGGTVQDAVARFAKTKPPHVKEDFEQECFIELMGASEAIEQIFSQQGEKPARNYVYGICRNRIANLLARLNKYENATLPIQFVQDSFSQSPQVETDLDEAIRKLPKEQEYIIRASFYQGKSEREIAKELNTNDTMVHRIKQKALVRLKKFLER